MKKPIKLEMTFSKSTKGTHVYVAKATGNPPPITSLYVARWAFDGEPPADMTVTLS
jgi:hypothetical protein